VTDVSRSASSLDGVGKRSVRTGAGGREGGCAGDSAKEARRACYKRPQGRPLRNRTTWHPARRRVGCTYGHRQAAHRLIGTSQPHTLTVDWVRESGACATHTQRGHVRVHAVSPAAATEPGLQPSSQPRPP
jgi:hypothetical protein